MIDLFAELLRALAEQDENEIAYAESRLNWKADRNAENAKQRIREEAAQARMLLEDLKKPEDTAAYQYAKRYLDEAITANNDKTEAEKEYERKRAALEREYFQHLQDRLQFEKMQASIRQERSVQHGKYRN